jgi:serine/threonine protein kinase
LHRKGTDDAWNVEYTEIKIGGELGRGAFGVVFRATWRHTEVAVKQLDFGGASPDPEQVQAFADEAELMRNIRPHPHVLLSLGVCTDPGYPLCILTEFMAKGSLWDYLENSSNDVTNAQKLKILGDVAKGMQHLVSEGVVHRGMSFVLRLSMIWLQSR